MEMPAPTWLHRFSGYAPGRVPAWLVSTSGCGLSFDLLSVPMILGCGLFLFTHLLSVALLFTGFAALIVFEVWIRVRIEAVERKARAILRREMKEPCSDNLSEVPTV